MPLANVIIGLFVVVVPLWVVFVFVVVKIQSSDPGEEILVDESVARPGYAIVYVTDDETGDGYHDSVSERRADLVADGQQSLGIQGSGISSVGQRELTPVASNGTEHGRRHDRRVEVAIFADDKLKETAESGRL